MKKLILVAILLVSGTISIVRAEDKPKERSSDRLFDSQKGGFTQTVR